MRRWPKEATAEKGGRAGIFISSQERTGKERQLFIFTHLHDFRHTDKEQSEDASLQTKLQFTLFHFYFFISTTNLPLTFMQTNRTRCVWVKETQPTPVHTDNERYENAGIQSPRKDANMQNLWRSVTLLL